MKKIFFIFIVFSFSYTLSLNHMQNKKAILLPLYSYPDLNKYNSIWKKVVKLKKKYPKKRIVTIVNPNNGNFNNLNIDFANGIKTLSNAGIEVIGYVYTHYGNRNIHEVLKKIDNWNKFYKSYGITGIFFDEVSTDKNNLQYYTNLTQYAKSKGFNFNVLNPGTNTNQIYINSSISNVIIVYENNYQNFKKFTPKISNTSSSKTSIGFLIYSIDGNKIKELYQFAKKHNIGYLYFTEDNDSNPWDSVSKYLEYEIKMLNN
jgi:hypothetical protein